jgi:hypothetical protein
MHREVLFSLVIDPTKYDPSIAFYICSNASRVNEGAATRTTTSCG